MFDTRIRPLIDPPLNAAGRAIASRGITADQITIAGFLVGLLAVPALWGGQTWLALFFILCNRIADGLDGAVARATKLSDSGGYLDIVLDFIFYASVPLGFALMDPATNALPAAVLLFAFMGTGSSFLTFAIMAAKNGLETDHQGKKSLYYLQGLTEGFETIALFVLCCLLPGWFWLLALIYAVMCAVTTITRIWTSVQTFR